MGEAEIEECPVDIPPAERVRQGWRTTALQAMQESIAPQAAIKRTGTYLPRPADGGVG